MDIQRRSSGTAKAGLATGITGTVLGAVNALTGNGGNNGGGNENCNNWGPGPWGPWGYGGWGGYAPFGYGFGGYGGYGGGWGCSEDRYVNRYELNMEQQLAEKDSQIALRDANVYNDRKSLELYQYFDGEIKDIRRELAAQAVVNQKTADSFEMAKRDLDCCCERLSTAIQSEARERRCQDNQIITYTNATFYPKEIAGITTNATVTPQTLYNPLSDDCCCNRSRQ